MISPQIPSPHSLPDSAKTIVCYGDSNTWGNIPRTNSRYPRSERWTGVLQNLLGNEYEVANEGLCGRTFVASEPSKPHRVGISHLRSILETHDPIDTLIIMLGTNDVKSTFNLSAEEITQHLAQTLFFIKEGKFDIEPLTRTIVICPPRVIMPSDGNLDERMVRGIEISRQLPPLFKEVAEKEGCLFLDAGEYVSFSTIDGYHLDQEGHLMLARAVAQIIQKT